MEPTTFRPTLSGQELDRDFLISHRLSDNLWLIKESLVAHILQNSSDMPQSENLQKGTARPLAHARTGT